MEGWGTLRACPTTRTAERGCPTQTGKDSPHANEEIRQRSGQSRQGTARGVRPGQLRQGEAGGRNLVVRAKPKSADKVAVVTLGGSGHEPALSGYVGGIYPRNTPKEANIFDLLGSFGLMVLLIGLGAVPIAFFKILMSPKVQLPCRLSKRFVRNGRN